MLVQEIIRHKRDGLPLAEAEIAQLVEGLTTGSVTEGQAAAFAMAVFFRGMAIDECAALTRAMMRSGEVLDWSGAALHGPVLDKHSTGGVGDNISLMLAPALAACGAYVPMISGRGLGHTGGTLDKLDSIPGYTAQPARDLFIRTVREVGCAIIGQTAELAPADKRLYAIRDVTATVESIPLITASILSKKLAAGLQGLVMDVKTGSGAFMARHEDARALAQSLATVATAAGLPTVSLITDMNEPLADCAGNAIEVLHALDHLSGRRRQPRVHEVVLALGAHLLVLGRLFPDVAQARAAMERAFASGAAAEHFQRMVVALGGPSDLLEHPHRSLAMVEGRPVPAPLAGHVSSIDTRALGLAVVALGGGRTRPQDAIDHAVGLSALVGLGCAVEAGDPLCLVHARDNAAFAAASKAVQAAYGLAPEAPAPQPVIREIVAA
jgi:thymidine phosphorylase